MIDYSHLLEMVRDVSERFPERIALASKQDGGYVPILYADFYRRICGVMGWLSSQGVEPGDRVALWSTNCPEWAIFDLAIMGVGAVVVPIYPTLSVPEVQFILEDSGAKMVLVRDKAHLDQVSGCRCVVMGDIGEGIHEGAQYLLEGQADLASLVYTSGTTGRPKGVMLTHENFLTNVGDALAAFPLSCEDVVLSFLPLSHVFERTTGYYTILAVGGAIYYAESMETVPQNLLEVRPTALVSVPRLYEKIYAKILSDVSGVRGIIFRWAVMIGKVVRVFEKKDQKLGWFLQVQYRLADRLVFSKIRDKVGGRLRFFVSGGAPLAKELGEFFEAVGLLICEGYGMTESSPVIAANRVDEYRFGTVGLAFDHVEVSLADDGELLARGPSIMKGYWNLPAETAEAIDSEGWLHTGDIATIDPDGFIAIVDRKKELIVLSNGKKVPPQMVENRLKMSAAISQAMVHGEKRSYLTALIVPEWTVVEKQVGSRDGKDAKVIAYLQGEVDRVSADLAHFEQVKKIVVLAEEFSQENGELTVSLKLKRRVILEKYQGALDALYD